ncbi:diguanylate cyclase regulator RdcB family protein [Shigella flexneri]
MLAYNASSSPGSVQSLLEELRWVHLAMPFVWEARKRWRCCWVICCVKATATSAESINAAPTTRHYYHQWFAPPPFRRAGLMLIFGVGWKVDHGR